MNKWIKKHIPTTKSLENSKQIKKLKPFFHSATFWKFEPEPVARGVAAGLAGALIPGFQLFYAAILALLLRGNLPVALVCTLVTNPLTVIPITYFIYSVGSLIINNGKHNLVLARLKWDFSSFSAFEANVKIWLLQFGKAFFVGLPIVSVCLAILGYFGTLLVFRILKKKQ